MSRALLGRQERWLLAGKAGFLRFLDVEDDGVVLLVGGGLGEQRAGGEAEADQLSGQPGRDEAVWMHGRAWLW